MTKEHVKSALKAHAEGNMPPNPNLWPYINTRLQTTFAASQPQFGYESHPLNGSSLPEP